MSQNPQQPPAPDAGEEARLDEALAGVVFAEDAVTLADLPLEELRRMTPGGAR